MSILKNFVNPWESTGELGSQALGTEVLEGNVVEQNNQDKITSSQEIIPVAYLFAHDSTSVSNSDLEKIKKEIVLIYKKNELIINIKVVTKGWILEKQKNKFQTHELAIGIIFKAQTKGLSDFIKISGKYSDQLTVYYDDEGKYLHTYATYEFAMKKGDILHYKVGFFAAHELLHQMIIKASCQIHGFKSKNTDDSISHHMAIDSDRFEIHANTQPNLNLDAELFNDFGVTVPEYRPRNNKPSKIEYILHKHLDLILSWTNPKSFNTPPPIDYFIKEDSNE